MFFNQGYICLANLEKRIICFALIEIMTYKKLKSINLCFVFVLSYLFFGVESFTPVGRMGHSSILAEDMLYFFGGNNSDFMNEVFYLDVSKSFNSKTPPWTDLTQGSGIPFKSSWATVSLKEQTIYLFGGIMYSIITDEDAFVSHVYSFNLNSLKWDIPNIEGTQPERRRILNNVMDNTGKMYIFGGLTCPCLSAPKTELFNDMVILDTVRSLWSISKPVNAPSKRYG